jgi:hypothetical protein
MDGTMFPPEEGVEKKRGCPLVNNRRDAGRVREEENRLCEASPQVKSSIYSKNGQDQQDWADEKPATAHK